MALESLRDPLSRLSALPAVANIAYDFNNVVNDVPSALWAVDRQYVQNDVVFVNDGSNNSSAYVLTGATSLLGGASPDTEEAWQWVSMAGYKAYPSPPPPPSTMTVFARMPSVSVSAWRSAAKVGRK